MTGNNMFAYCNNNPVMGIDPLGQWTFSIGISVSAFLGAGSTYSWVLSFDSCGNVALQETKADSLKKESGGTFGLGSAGVSLLVTITPQDTVDDLEGESLTAGGSVPFGFLYAGGEVITNLEMDEFGGVSLYGGIGVGIDVHSTVSVTETLWKTRLPNRTPVMWLAHS